MTQAVTDRIRDAARQAETKAQEAVSHKQYDKAADYFDFAATQYINWSEAIEDEDQKKYISKRTEKLARLAKQCRNVLKRAEMEKFVKANEKAAGKSDQRAQLNADPDQEATVIPGAPPRPKFDGTGNKLPAARMPSRVSKKKLAAQARAKAQRARKIAKAANEAGRESVADADEEWASDPHEFDATWMHHHDSDDTLNDLPEGFVPPVAPMSKHAHGANTSVDHGVSVQLAPADFPPIADTGRFALRLGERFTQHLADALIGGDLDTVAAKFSRLADNLVRHALSAELRHEIDLRFTALVCREVADRLKVGGGPIKEVLSAREAFEAGDFVAAAKDYRRAALVLLKGDADASDNTVSLNESKAGEYLNLSSRLRLLDPDMSRPGTDEDEQEDSRDDKNE